MPTAKEVAWKPCQPQQEHPRGLPHLRTQLRFQTFQGLPQRVTTAPKDHFSLGPGFALNVMFEGRLERNNPAPA